MHSVGLLLHSHPLLVCSISALMARCHYFLAKRKRKKAQVCCVCDVSASACFVRERLASWRRPRAYGLAMCQMPAVQALELLGESPLAQRHCVFLTALPDFNSQELSAALYSDCLVCLFAVMCTLPRSECCLSVDVLTEIPPWFIMCCLQFHHCFESSRLTSLLRGPLTSKSRLWLAIA